MVSEVVDDGMCVSLVMEPGRMPFAYLMALILEALVTLTQSLKTSNWQVVKYLR